MGVSISHDDANYDGVGGKDGWEKTSPVGSFAPNGYGLYDMAGNVWEWCADWYGSYPVSRQNNPTGPSSGSQRVLRVGSYYNDTSVLRCANRGYNNPSLTFTDVGFRCGASSQEPNMKLSPGE